MQHQMINARVSRPFNHSMITQRCHDIQQTNPIVSCRCVNICNYRHLVMTQLHIFAIELVNPNLLVHDTKLRTANSRGFIRCSRHANERRIMLRVSALALAQPRHRHQRAVHRPRRVRRKEEHHIRQRFWRHPPARTAVYGASNCR